MKTQRRADIVAGCFVALLGAMVIIAASQIRGDVEERLPPRTLPYVVGAMTLIGGVALTVKSWRFRGTDPVIKWPERDGTIKIVVSLISLAVYTALMEPLGMPIATALYVAFSIWYLDRKRIITAVLSGAVSAAAVYYLFIKLLGLSLPLGPLER